jgi:hypothetical protein
LQGTVLRGEAREVTAAENIACAMGAGAFSALVYSPVDLTTIQQQKLNLSPGATMAHIVREHGAAGVFRGFMSMALREAIYTGGYLGLAPVLSSQFSEMAAFENSP